MQEDAAVRVREMKRRAAIVVGEDENIRREEVKKSVPDEVKHISYPVEIEEKTDKFEKIADDRQRGLIDVINADSDSVLVLLILILLSGEETDQLTSLALLYLLL